MPVMDITQRKTLNYCFAGGGTSCNFYNKLQSNFVQKIIVCDEYVMSMWALPRITAVILAMLVIIFH